MGLFGPTPHFDAGATQPYTSALNSIATGFGSQGRAAQDQFGQFNANDVNALKALSNYYKSNPATEQYNAEQTANASQAARDAAAAGTAQLDRNLAARGISPNSSMGVGGLAAINNQQISTNADIQAQQGERNQELHAQNLAADANLWNNAANTEFGRANTLQNQQAGLEQQGFSNADTLAMQRYQEQLQRQQGEEALAGGLFDTAANLFVPGAGAFSTGRKVSGGGIDSYDSSKPISYTNYPITSNRNPGGVYGP